MFDIASLLQAFRGGGAGGPSGNWTNPDTGVALPPNKVGGLLGSGVSPQQAQMLAQMYGGIAGGANNGTWMGALAQALGTGLGAHYGGAATDAQGAVEADANARKSKALSRVLSTGIDGLSDEQNATLASSGLGLDEVESLAKLMKSGKNKPYQVFDPEKGKTVWFAPGTELDGKIVGYSNYPRATAAGGGAAATGEDGPNDDPKFWRSAKIYDNGDGIPRYFAPGTSLHDKPAAQVRGGASNDRLGGLFGDQEDEEPEAESESGSSWIGNLGKLISGGGGNEPQPGAADPVISTDRPAAADAVTGASEGAAGADPAMKPLADMIRQAPAVGGAPAAPGAAPVDQVAPAAVGPAMTPPNNQAVPGVAAGEPVDPVQAALQQANQRRQATLPQGPGPAPAAPGAAAGGAQPAPLDANQRLDVNAVKQMPPGSVIEMPNGMRFVIGPGGSMRKAQ